MCDFLIVQIHIKAVNILNTTVQSTLAGPDI